MTVITSFIEVSSAAPDVDACLRTVPGTNDSLRELVEASGLPAAVALTIFNRGLPVSAACPESQWKAFLADPQSARFQELSEEQLAHAIHQFARIGVHREAV